MQASSSSNSVLCLGTRGSMLARTQSQLVADQLQRAHPGLRVELVVIKTSGDRIADGPLYEFGGKGLFTREIEQALIDGQIDVAVHSFKDVPVTTPLVDDSSLIVAAVPEREDARDVLVTGGGGVRRIAELPQGARIGTSSLRRRCQLLALRHDLIIEPIRGNIDTRLRKQRAGEFDAIVLAAAGLRRAGLFDSAEMALIDLSELLPAAGQGALAIQCRRDDASTRQLLAVLDHPPTATCVKAERALVSALAGDCQSPIAVLAEIESLGGIHLRATVGAAGGDLPVIHAAARTPLAEPQDAVAAVFARLSDQQVQKLLGHTG